MNRVPAIILELLLLGERYSIKEMEEAEVWLSSDRGQAEIGKILQLLNTLRESAMPNRSAARRKSSTKKPETPLSSEEQRIVAELASRLGSLSLRAIRNGAKDLDLTIPSRSSRQLVLARIARHFTGLPIEDVRSRLDRIFGPPRRKDAGFAELAEEIIRPKRRDRTED